LAFSGCFSCQIHKIRHFLHCCRLKRFTSVDIASPSHQPLHRNQAFHANLLSPLSLITTSQFISVFYTPVRNGKNTSTPEPSVFQVGHDPRSAAGEIRPLVVLMSGAGVVEHVIRNGGPVDVDKLGSRHLTINLHHCYAPDRRLHCRCINTCNRSISLITKTSYDFLKDYLKLDHKSIVSSRPSGTIPYALSYD